jgi:hypothetical protein
MTESSTSLATFKSRIYDILSNSNKLATGARIGTLSARDSAVCTFLSTAAEQFQEDTALELAEAALDGLVATLLAVYDNGLPEGAKMQNPNVHKLAELLAEAGKHGRTEVSASGSHD